MIYDIVIIGGGITGCMIAYKLAKYHLDVAVIEAGEDVASGCTKANSAIVHAGYDPLPGTLKAKLNVKGCAQLPSICRELGVKYFNCGSYVVAYSENDMPALNKLYERGIANGVEGLKIVSRDELVKAEPNIADTAVAALYAPSAGIICPYGLCIAVAEVAKINGCDFYFNRKVDRVSKDSNAFTVGSGKDFEINTKFVINACGCGVEEIAKIAGDVHFPLTILPRRGEYMLLDKNERKTANSTIFACPTKEGKGVLVSPTADGNIIVGPNAHLVDSADINYTTEEGLEEIQLLAKKMVKNLNTRAVITSFAGVRPTPKYKDGGIDDFYISPSEDVVGLLHVAGIESPGLASSPAVADYAIEQLTKMGVILNKRDHYVAKPDNPKMFYDMTDDEKSEIIEKNPSYGRIVCRCEEVTEGDIIAAIRRPLGAKSIDMVKRRTRAGMGRCQGGFCSTKVCEILARELGVDMTDITKKGGNSRLLTGDIDDD